MKKKMLILCNANIHHNDVFIGQMDRFFDVTIDVLSVSKIEKKNTLVNRYFRLVLFELLPITRTPFLIFNLILVVLTMRKYDVICIQNVYGFYNNEKLLRILKKKTKRLVSVVWGCEIYNKDTVSVLTNCDYISFGTNELKIKTEEIHGVHFDNVLNAPLGKQNLELVYNMHTSKYNDAETVKRVIVGYNTSEIQNHIPIIDELEKEFSESGITFVFPMTYAYGEAEKIYSSKVKERLSHSKLRLEVVDHFLTDLELMELWYSAEIMIQLQTRDGLSGATIEYLATNNILITGDWLPYEVLSREGVYFETISEISEICKRLKNVVNHYSELKTCSVNNSELLNNMLSWPAVSTKWGELLGITDVQKVLK